MNAAKALGAEYSGDGWDADGSFTLSGLDDDLAQVVEGVSSDQGSDGWMVGWTGAAADAAANGFFQTTWPTLNNHILIANALGYLVNLRATIIDRNRINALDLIASATGALGEKTDVDLTGRWKVVQGIGMTLSLTGVGAVGGAPLTFVGWLGEQLYPEKKEAAFASEPHEVAAGLGDAFATMESDVASSETDYANAASEVEEAIGSTVIEALELYDITRNDPEGTAGKDGEFEVDIDDLTGLAHTCYAVAEAYEEVRTQLRNAYDADPHLGDRNGDPTVADNSLIAIREDLLNFMTTSIGRWTLMGGQIEDAAREYAEEDESSERTFELWEDSMDEQGQGPPISEGKAGAWAEATDNENPSAEDTSGEAEGVVYDDEGWQNDASDPKKD